MSNEDPVEALRQRVKELEQQNEMLVNRMAHIICVNGALRADSAELATLKQGQGEPVAWMTFDGEGGHDLRLYECNETYRDDFIARNGEKYKEWVTPLYTSAPNILPKMVILSYRQKPVSPAFAEGWNAYRGHILSAAPKPREQK